MGTCLKRRKGWLLGLVNLSQLFIAQLHQEEIRSLKWSLAETKEVYSTVHTTSSLAYNSANKIISIE